MESVEKPEVLPGEREREAHRERIKELEAEIARLKRESETDPLTGTYNRRGLKERVDEGRAQGKRNETAFLIVDADNFKMVNELYGHEAGDAALKAVAAFLHGPGASRAKDIVARWGGEEFVVAYNGADAQDVINKFYEPEDPSQPDKERRAKINVPVAMRDGEKPFTLTLSGGVATQREGEPMEETIGRADAALLRAKERKDRIESAETDR